MPSTLPVLLRKELGTGAIDLDLATVERIVKQSLTVHDRLTKELVDRDLKEESYATLTKAVSQISQALKQFTETLRWLSGADQPVKANDPTFQETLLEYLTTEQLHTLDMWMREAKIRKAADAARVVEGQVVQ